MSIYLHLLLGGLIRLVTIIYGEWHDQNMSVKFTDVDYRVFTDAAAHIVNGSSPFQRHTYRYTPLLAFLLTPNIFFMCFGKIVFSAFDLITSYAIFKSVKTNKTLSSGLWLYNPMCILICTRGNAECIMTTLTIGFLNCLLTKHYCFAALLYGFSIHFKIYPIIYALTVYFHLSKKPLLNNLLPNRKIILFGVITFGSIMIPTIFSYLLYGNKYLFEALLYHLNRRDIRHNFSPYFYLLYLSDQTENNLIGLLVFVPQLFLLIVFALKYNSSGDLAFNFFCSTFIFVMFNKVCTSQYFLWFLCYLPLIVSKFNISKMKALTMVTFWLMAQALWLLAAYLLEFQGINTFFYIWMCGIGFFCTNVWVLNELLVGYNSKSIKKIV